MNHLTRLMAISLSDFLRLLPGIAGVPVAHHHTEGQLEIPARGVTLSWRMMPAVDFGAMQLPQLEVTLQFHGSETQLRENFMKDFDQTYQRGGG